MTKLERVEGVVVQGFQPEPEGPGYMLCMDPETGTTFAVRAGETIGAALHRVVTRYRLAVKRGNGHAHGLCR